MHDSTHCPLCQGVAGPGEMTDEQFEAFLEACRAELREKQASFTQRTGNYGKWSYDLSTERLTLGEETFAIVAVGSHSPSHETWLWGWANEDYPQNARSAAQQIQQLFELTGFRVFTDPGCPASSLDAQDFTALALHQLGGCGMFRIPSKREDGPTTYLAVLGPVPT
jgi:hypothetical protein